MPPPISLHVVLRPDALCVLYVGWYGELCIVNLVGGWGTHTMRDAIDKRFGGDTSTRGGATDPAEGPHHLSVSSSYGLGC